VALRVLHVFKVYLPENVTGIPRVIWELATGLVPHGVRSSVLATGKPQTKSPLVLDGHAVHLSPRQFRLASTDISVGAVRLFRELAKDADIVHYHFPWPMLDLLDLFARPSAATVLTYHSDIVGQRLLLPVYRPLMRRLLQRVDRIVATSPNYLATSPTLQQFAAKTTVIPIGIGERQRPSADLVARWRERVGEGFFLFVGAPRYYKGLPFLLEAARATGLPVVLVGAGMAAASIRDLPPNVIVAGQVTDLDREALLDLSLSLVLPSHLRAEAFGIVLLEAARASRAAISCELGTGSSLVNIDGVTGLEVPPADAGALATAMQRLAADPGQSRGLGQKGRERYEEQFTAAMMGARYLELYRELAGKQ
jgi:glycosyltransferase involved in cell wall biosynthesis